MIWNCRPFMFIHFLQECLSISSSGEANGFGGSLMLLHMFEGSWNKSTSSRFKSIYIHSTDQVSSRSHLFDHFQPHFSSQTIFKLPVPSLFQVMQATRTRSPWEWTPFPEEGSYRPNGLVVVCSHDVSLEEYGAWNTEMSKTWNYECSHRLTKCWYVYIFFTIHIKTIEGIKTHVSAGRTNSINALPLSQSPWFTRVVPFRRLGIRAVTKLNSPGSSKRPPGERHQDPPKNICNGPPCPPCCSTSGSFKT